MAEEDPESAQRKLSASPTSIAILSPELGNLSSRVLRGRISLKWPYSASRQALAFILTDIDIALRANKGQVRVEFTGRSAKAVEDSGLAVGDEVFLCLEGAELLEDDGKNWRSSGLGWQLRFAKRVLLKTVGITDQESKLLDFDDPRDPEPPTPLPVTTVAEPDDVPAPTPVRHPAVQQIVDRRTSPEADEFRSPAFVKRARISFGSLYDGGDMFEEDGAARGKGRKRTRFGRDSGAWRYSSQSPDRDSEDEASVEEAPPIAPQVEPAAQPAVEPVVEHEVEPVAEAAVEQVATPVVEPRIEAPVDPGISHVDNVDVEMTSEQPLGEKIQRSHGSPSAEETEVLPHMATHTNGLLGEEQKNGVYEYVDPSYANGHSQDGSAPAASSEVPSKTPHADRQMGSQDDNFAPEPIILSSDGPTKSDAPESLNQAMQDEPYSLPSLEQLAAQVLEPSIQTPHLDQNPLSEGLAREIPETQFQSTGMSTMQDYSLPGLASGHGQDAGVSWSSDYLATEQSKASAYSSDAGGLRFQDGSANAEGSYAASQSQDVDETEEQTTPVPNGHRVALPMTEDPEDDGYDERDSDYDNEVGGDYDMRNYADLQDDEEGYESEAVGQPRAEDAMDSEEDEEEEDSGYEQEYEGYEEGTPNYEPRDGEDQHLDQDGDADDDGDESEDDEGEGQGAALHPPQSGDPIVIDLISDSDDESEAEEETDEEEEETEEREEGEGDEEEEEDEDKQRQEEEAREDAADDPERQDGPSGERKHGDDEQGPIPSQVSDEERDHAAEDQDESSRDSAYVEVEAEEGDEDRDGDGEEDEELDDNAIYAEGLAGREQISTVSEVVAQIGEGGRAGVEDAPEPAQSRQHAAESFSAPTNISDHRDESIDTKHMQHTERAEISFEAVEKRISAPESSVAMVARVDTSAVISSARASESRPEEMVIDVDEEDDKESQGRGDESGDAQLVAKTADHEQQGPAANGDAGERMDIDAQVQAAILQAQVATREAVAMEMPDDGVLAPTKSPGNEGAKTSRDSIESFAPATDDKGEKTAERQLQPSGHAAPDGSPAKPIGQIPPREHGMSPPQSQTFQSQQFDSLESELRRWEGDAETAAKAEAEATAVDQLLTPSATQPSTFPEVELLEAEMGSRASQAKEQREHPTPASTLDEQSEMTQVDKSIAGAATLSFEGDVLASSRTSPTQVVIPATQEDLPVSSRTRREQPRRSATSRIASSSMVPATAEAEETSPIGDKRGEDAVPGVESRQRRSHRRNKLSRGSDAAEEDTSIRLARASMSARKTRESSSLAEDPSVRVAKASIASRRSTRHDGPPPPESLRVTRGRSRSIQMSDTSELAESLKSPGLTEAAEAEGATAASLKLQLIKDLRAKLPDFTSLKVLRQYPQKTVDVMAVATAAPGEAKRPKSGPRDYMLSLTVTDPSIAPGGVALVQMFRPHQRSLPVVKAGDVLLLRRLSVHAMMNRGWGLRTGEASSWAVFERGEEEGLPQIRGPPVEVQDREVAHADMLAEWWGRLDVRAMERLEQASRKQAEEKK